MPRFTVHFSDKTSITLSQEDGEWLKDQLLLPRSPERVDLNGVLYKTSTISKIEPEKRWASDIPTMKIEQWKQLTGGCRGKNSIARSIIKVAVQNRVIPKLKDPEWRKEMRAALWKEYPDTKWCDPEKNSCGCDTL